MIARSAKRRGPGRPQISAYGKRDKPIPVSLTDRELGDLRSAALEAGYSLTAYVRMMLGLPS